MPSGGPAVDPDALARRESFNRHLYRPNSYLHKWWARRCGTTFRWILKQLVEDPARRDYYAPGGLEGKVVLDPMMGGGTTLHEAVRLGASVIGVDVDPIPVLQARASLRRTPLPLLEEAYGALKAGLRAALAPAWQSACPHCAAAAELRFVLHGLRRECDCGERTFVDSLVLREEPGGGPLRLCAACLQIGRSDACSACGTPHGAGALALPGKGQPRCERCGQPFRDLVDTPYYARFRTLALVGDCPAHGRFFRAPDAADEEARQQADRARAGLGFEAGDFGIEPGPKSRDLTRRGVRSYLDLFSSRQLHYLRAAVDLLAALPAAARLDLGLLISTSLEFHSLLCGYKGGHARRPGAIRHTFSHHAYSFPYTALEANPAYPGSGSGTLDSLFDRRIRHARAWALQPVERRLDRGAARSVAIPGELDSGIEVEDGARLREGPRRFLLLQRSATRLPLARGSVDYVVTDPPYFDSVQYSDLAAFFRVWLRRLLPQEAGWDYDIRHSAVDSPQHDAGHYERTLGAILAECRRVLKPETGRLVLTFHHWRAGGWAALTLALRGAGFRLAGFEVIHAENPASVHIANLRALTHDAILELHPAGRPGGPAWPRVDAVDMQDSERFCRGCAAALGWMLGLPGDADLQALWRALLSSGRDTARPLAGLGPPERAA